MDWLEHTYEKIGNQISIEPVGYTKARHQKDDKRYDSDNHATLYIKVTNHGLSNQVHDDFRIKVNNYDIKV